MKTSDPHAPLRGNVKLLGNVLGRTLKVQVGEFLYEKIETIRNLSKEAQKGDHGATRALNTLLSELTPAEILTVVRAFSHFLNFANICENVHRIRRTRWYQIYHQSSPQVGSIEATMQDCHERGISDQQLLQTILDLRIDLVLTAHPTEVIRRTLMQKFDRIANLLCLNDEKILTESEIKTSHSALESEVTAIWQTDEIRRRRPTPIDEAKWGLAVIEGSLWVALPSVLREIDNQLKKYTGKSLPLEASPIRFSSWMGGDRDGNPNVTSETTEKVILMARWVAADLYSRQVSELSAALSMQHCSEELRKQVGAALEPYREHLRPLKLRLLSTMQWVEAKLRGKSGASEKPIESSEEILSPLLLCYRSLIACNGEVIANAALIDLIRRVVCFGITLVRVDIRQEAIKHAQLLDEVTQFFGLGSYVSWNEEKRFQFLVEYCQNENFSIPTDIKLSPSSKEVWKTFQMIGLQLEASLGAYVVSMAKQPSDVLIVYFFQKLAKVRSPLRVVPLFETLNDLKNASSCLETLFNCDLYQKTIHRQQEIMIGYSDSGKDAGILAAGWAQYLAQEQCVQIAKKHKIALTLFHGRGGSIGRGGAPAHIAILSQPPGSVHGSLRVTEQGEVIRNKYSLPQRAYRSLELYFTAVLEATLFPPPAPKPHWREMMERLANVSYEEYAECIKSDESFFDYFNQVTPIEEIGRLSIGSRPARRSEKYTLESLRAIPWVFAWTQNRLLLSAWLGVGKALENAHLKNGREIIAEMTEKWPFFRTLLSLVEMVLSKADPEIALLYEQKLASESLKPLGELLRQKYQKTVNVVKMTLKENQLLESNPLLQRTIELRAPYLYPLHMLQAELLKRIRSAKYLKDDEQNALLISISGIAAGMQNTG